MIKGSLHHEDITIVNIYVPKIGEPKYIMILLVSCYSFWFKIYFVWHKCSFLCFFLVSIYIEHLFPPLHFESCMSLNQKQISCRCHVVGSFLFFYPFNHPVFWLVMKPAFLVKVWAVKKMFYVRLKRKYILYFNVAFR